MNSVEKEIFVHIGYPKSASTTIQKNLFAHHPEIEYPSVALKTEDKTPFQLREDVYDFFTYLTKDDTYSDDVLKDFFNSTFVPIIEESNKRIVIISDEHCTRGKIPFEKVADRLNSFELPFKILVVIRNQYDLLRSMYDMHPFLLDINDSQKTVSFSEWLNAMLNSNKSNISTVLDYNKVINYYAKLFGKENINIVLFETLQKAPKQFALEIANILNIEPQKTEKLLLQPSLNDFSAHAAAKWKQKYFYWVKLSSILPKGLHQQLVKTVSKFIKPNKTVLDQEVKNKIQYKYAEGNQKLSNDYKLALDKYNYPL